MRPSGREAVAARRGDGNTLYGGKFLRLLFVIAYYPVQRGE
jgi:hypothetical protein